jgi:hypothetical protein
LLGIKRTNVNNLPIVYGTKRFDDGTVAQYQLIHGREIVNVVAPIPPVPSGEEHIRITRIDEIEQIVPCMRSTDNKWWVACLSGTFEPGYYLFGNIYDIPSGAFDDTIETDLDGQLISEGQDPIEGEELPSLHFIAQTGRRDTGTTNAYEDGNFIFSDTRFSYVTDPRYSVDSSTVKWSEYTNSLYGHWVNCPPGYAGVAVYDISYNYNETFFNYYTYTGEEIPISRSRIGFSQDFLGQAGTKTWGVDIEYNPPPGPLGSGLKSFFGEVTFVFDYSKVIINGISIEESNMFACFFCDQINDEIKNFNNGTGTCEEFATSQETPWNYETPHKRTYFFQVDGLAFAFYLPSVFSRSTSGFYYLNEEYGPDEGYNDGCFCDSNMLKYYGEVSLADTTGIMCCRINTWNIDEYGLKIEEKCAGFYYNYIGPNTETIKTTFFPQKDGGYTHLIDGIPEEIEFKGEIFLGLVKYEVETVVEDR